MSQELPPETAWGGIGTYVDALAPALVACGAEVHVLSVVGGQARSTRVRDDGVVVHRAPLRRPRGVGRLSRLPQTWGRVSLAAAVAREHRRLGVAFDVAEAPDWMAEGWLLARRRVVPLVVRLHSSLARVDEHLRVGGVDVRLAQRIEADQVARADVVTGTASALAEESAVQGSAASVRRIPCPVALPPSAPDPVGAPRVCFVGRFEPRKGAETLVRAWPAVRAAVPDARLVLAGRDMPDASGRSTASELRALAAELGVADSVELVERWLSAAEVRAEQAAAHVCAVPSRWESFGYSAAEAAALGRPVVASRLDALADVVDDGRTGLLVAPGDSEAWADALSRLLRNPAEAAALGRRGAALVRERFAPAVVARATMAAYEAAIQRHRAPSNKE